MTTHFLTKQKIKETVTQMLNEPLSPLYRLFKFAECDVDIENEKEQRFDRVLMTLFAFELDDFSVDFKKNDAFKVFACFGIPDETGEIQEILEKIEVNMSLNRLTKIAQRDSKLANATFFEVHFIKSLIRFLLVREDAIYDALYLKQQHLENIVIL